MRRLRLAALTAMLLPALVPAQDAKDAEKLFRTLEDRIRKAQSVRLGFTIDAGREPQKVHLQGTFAFAAGNKVHLAADVTYLGVTTKATVVSDGAKMRILAPDAPKAKKKPPATQAILLADIFARAGLYSAFRGVHKGDVKKKAGKVEEVFQIWDFRLGPREKVGERDAQVVRYTLRLDTSEDVTASVWVDTRTGLPLKRTLALQREQAARVVEVYTDLKVDEPLDPKLFDLNK